MTTAKKHSRKRDAILDYLQHTVSHPTAEMVYSALKPQLPDLSLATVYRNLSMFKEEGIIASVGVISGMERFDADLHLHAHMICKKCGAVVDTETPTFSKKQLDSLQCDTGVQVESYRVIFYGLCADCCEKAAAENINKNNHTEESQ